MIKNNCSKILKKINETSEIWWDSTPMYCNQFLDEDHNISADEKEALKVLFDFNNSNSIVKGVTTNPNIIRFEVYRHIDDYKQYIKENSLTKLNSFNRFNDYVVKKSSDILYDLWKKSNGQYGWVCAQLNPENVSDLDKMRHDAFRLSKLNKNVMVKVPVTKEGCILIEELAGQGISTNGTFSFNTSQALAYAQAIYRGRKAFEKNNSITPWRAVSTFMIGRFQFMGELLKEAKQTGISLSERDLAWAGILISKRISSLFSTCAYPVKLLLSSLVSEDPLFSEEIMIMNLLNTSSNNVIYTCRPSVLKKLMNCSVEDYEKYCKDDSEESLKKLLKLNYFNKSYDPIGFFDNDFHKSTAFSNTINESFASHKMLTLLGTNSKITSPALQN